MTGYYDASQKFHVSVDCIVFGLNGGKLSVLLTRRGFAPELGAWSLIGGFVRASESVDEAARRTLYELTGLEDVYMEQVGAFGEVDRDPGDRVISIAYYALINFSDHDRSRVRNHNATWVELSEMPRLALDHADMVWKALAALRSRFLTEPLGFNLLPEKFTLSQLQSLCETVLGTVLDKRNFRKRVGEVEAIELTGDIDKTTSRRGAALYRFNPDTYRKNHKFRI